MSKVQSALTQVIVELIETKAVLNELERSFPYLNSVYYWERKGKMERRKTELEAILTIAEIGFKMDAPIEQFLVTMV